MEFIDAFLAFLETDLASYIAYGLAFSGLLAQLAAMTPFGHDDVAAGYLNRFFSILAGNWGRAKSLPKS